MATLNALAEVIAEVEGIDRATVAWIGRSLREAGLVAKHGRGPSAAQMDWADAANLLIAVNGTRIAADAAKTAKKYRHLRPDEYEVPISEISRDFDFGEAIEQLLMAAASGELPRPFLGANRDDDVELTEMFTTGQVHIELRFRTNTPTALLRVAPKLESATPELMASIPSSVLLHFSPRKGRDPPKTRDDLSGDRVEETTIGFRTLRAVGELIRPHP